jgi:hypothetical protein
MPFALMEAIDYFAKFGRSRGSRGRWMRQLVPFSLESYIFIIDESREPQHKQFRPLGQF